jgi:hypothetical protein
VVRGTITSRGSRCRLRDATMSHLIDVIQLGASMGVRYAMAVGTRHLIITTFTASFTTRHETMA